MRDVIEQMQWLETATAEEIDGALVAGELDEMLGYHPGPGKVDHDQAALLVLIGFHLPELNLDVRHCRWGTLENGATTLVVDMSVVFAADGDDLLVTGQVPGAAIGAFRITPDHKWQLAQLARDPYSPQQASLN
jgi:hypothetical protein